MPAAYCIINIGSIGLLEYEFLRNRGMNTLVTATQHLSQPCGPLPVKNCRVRHEGNENGKNAIFEGD